MGFLYLGMVVLAITAVALIAKLASRRGVSAFGLSASLFAAGAVLGAILLCRHCPVKLTSHALLFSTVAGVGGAGAVLAFNVAVRQGHFGFSNAIYRCSFLIPIVYAVLFLDAALNNTTAFGIALILAGIFFMSWSTDSFSRGKKAEFKWFVLILIAFLLSGAPRVGQTLTSAYREDFYLYLFLSYAAGAAVFALEMGRQSISRHSQPVADRFLTSGAWTWGSAAAVASYVGVFCTLKSLQTLKPQVVFPISLSGPIIVGIFLSLALFREKIRFSGWLGVILGIAGITVLSIWK